METLEGMERSSTQVGESAKWGAISCANISLMDEEQKKPPQIFVFLYTKIKRFHFFFFYQWCLNTPFTERNMSTATTCRRDAFSTRDREADQS